MGYTQKFLPLIRAGIAYFDYLSNTEHYFYGDEQACSCVYWSSDPPIGSVVMHGNYQSLPKTVLPGLPLKDLPCCLICVLCLSVALTAFVVPQGLETWNPGTCSIPVAWNISSTHLIYQHNLHITHILSQRWYFQDCILFHVFPCWETQSEVHLLTSASVFHHYLSIDVKKSDWGGMVLLILQQYCASALPLNACHS